VLNWNGVQYWTLFYERTGGAGLAEILIWLNEQTGRRYVRTDKPTQRPREPGSPANPWEISIKGDCSTNTGELGIVKVALVNTTERTVMFPKRGGAYNPKNAVPSRPYYYVRDAETGRRRREYKVFCGDCGDYQMRDAFYADETRPNGLRWRCKTCESASNHVNYVRRKAKFMNAA
jgi:hypothetical protein